jgi:Spy/CpxP family protein refolding chaperone
MKKTIATLSLIITLSLGLLGFSQVYAQNKGEELSCPNCPNQMGMMEKPGMMMEQSGMMANKPEMTPEQGKEIHKLRMKLHQEIAPLRIDIETKEMELQELWMDDKPDVEKIVKKIMEIHKLQGQIQEKEIRHEFEIYKTLKPEQQKMFRQNHRMGMGPKAGFGPRMCRMGMGGCCQ